MVRPVCHSSRPHMPAEIVIGCSILLSGFIIEGDGCRPRKEPESVKTTVSPDKNESGWETLQAPAGVERHQ